MKQYDPNEAEDRARLMLAIVVSLTILLGFYFLVERPKNEERRARVAIEAAAQKNAEVEAGVAADDGGDLKTRAEVIAASGRRIRIAGDRVKGSIALKGARLDDLELLGRYKTVARQEEVELLSPTGAEGAYYVDNGWIANKSGVKLPNADSVWSLAAGSPDEIVSGGQPVVLTWDNGEGLLFTRSVTLDENYLFTVRDTVKNDGGEALDLNAYHMVARHGMPKDFRGFFVLHEGPVAFIGDKHIEPNYKDLNKGEKIEREDTAGWLGFSDKYWLVALLPDKDARFNVGIAAHMMRGYPL